MSLRLRVLPLRRVQLPASRALSETRHSLPDRVLPRHPSALSISTVRPGHSSHSTSTPSTSSLTPNVPAAMDKSTSTCRSTTPMSESTAPSRRVAPVKSELSATVTDTNTAHVLSIASNVAHSPVARVNSFHVYQAVSSLKLVSTPTRVRNSTLSRSLICPVESTQDELTRRIHTFYDSVGLILFLCYPSHSHSHLQAAFPGKSPSPDSPPAESEAQLRIEEQKRKEKEESQRLLHNLESRIRMRREQVFCDSAISPTENVAADPQQQPTWQYDLDKLLRTQRAVTPPPTLPTVEHTGSLAAASVALVTVCFPKSFAFLKRYTRISYYEYSTKLQVNCK